MTQTLLLLVFITISIQLVLTEPIYLSDLTENISYTDVQSARFGDFYVILRVGEATDGGQYDYSFAFYQLDNGNGLVRRNPGASTIYRIRSASGHLRLRAYASSTASGGLANVIVCSSATCGELIVGTNFNTVYVGTAVWCPKNWSNDSLLSFVSNAGYSVAVVRRQPDLYAFICLPSNSGFREIKLRCQDAIGSSTQIHSVHSVLKNGNVIIFVLLSNGPRTSLCMISITDGSSTNFEAPYAANLNFDNQPTALAVAPAADDFMAFVSSAAGEIDKVYFQGTGAYKIDNFKVQPPLQNLYSDMLLADDKLFLLTTNRVVLLDVKQTCEQYNTLCKCRAPKDPKCGWCVHSNLCTNNDTCIGGEEKIWIPAEPSSNTSCWNVTISPASVSRHRPEPLQINITEDMGAEKISGKNTNYRCMFGSINVTTVVSNAGEQSVTCAAPNSNDIDTFPEGTVTVPVVIFYSRRGTYLPLLAQYKLVVCSDIDNCGDCTQSHDSCTWCVADHKCTTTATADTNCPNSPSSARSTFGEKESCPRIENVALAAPVDVDYAMVLSTANLPTLSDRKVLCRVVTENELPVELGANRDGNVVTCNPHKFESNSPTSSGFFRHSFSVTILMGEEKWAVAEATGKTYNCSYQSVCRQCVQNVDGADCVWCSQSIECRYNSCPQPSSAIRDTCRSLDIEEVKPTNLPIEGNLTLTIQGQGLILSGRSSSARIDLSGQPCTNITTKTKDNDLDIFECITPSVTSSRKATLHVEIDGITWERKSYITYYDPKINNIGVADNSDHNYGPVAGGTDVLISGTELTNLQHTEWTVEFLNSTQRPSHGLPLLDCRIINDALRCKTPPVAALGMYHPLLKFTSHSYTRIIHPMKWFNYRQNSSITDFNPKQIIQWGGKDFTITGTHLDSVSVPKLRLKNSDILSRCRNVVANQMTCTYPEFEATGDAQIIVVMDGIDPSLTTLDVVVRDNPFFNNFEEPRTLQNELILDGKHIANVDMKDIAVFVGGETCNITKKESTTLICLPPELSANQENTDVTIEIYGKQRFVLGSLSYVAPGNAGLSDEVIGGIAGAGGAAVIIMVVVAVLLFRRSRYHKQRYKSMVKHVDQLECNSRHEIKQAFAELQTDMSDLMSDLNVTGIPYWDYKNFTFKILFPGQTDHPSLHKLMTKRKVAVMQALDMFEHLIQNKDFLMSFIHTLEDQPTFTMPDRVQLAALIMLTLQHKMDYTTIVIKELLSDLIKSSMREKHPKLLLRRSESVVEKMLTHWLSLCLYKYLQDHAGTPLFMLYKAIKHQIEKGPVDTLTGEARYSLSQERLLRLTVDTTPITLNVTLESGDKIQCKVNDIDTISQVKEKILDVIYKNQAYSLRPSAVDYNLEWQHGMVGVPICDEDLTSQTLNGWKRLNTLAHYSILDNAVMKLVSKHRPNSLHSDRSRDTDKLCDTLPSNRGTPRGTLTRTGALSISNLQDHYVHNHISLWHLSKSAASQTLPKDRQQTMMSEIFLTRLLKTKGTLQEFIDSLFQMIFSADNLPPTIKFLFDFLDQEAVKHGITDPEVVHIWKNNSLNLRFWVNIIKNPEFVFDIHKSEVVDASLSTIAQTFIDSCAMTESDIGADAPINKLLFARDRPRYRKMLQNMYSEIRNKPPVAEQTLNAHLNELSKMYPREVYRNSALKEIYQYAQRYQTQILQDLEDNFPKHRNPNLTSLLRDIHATLDDRHTQLNDYV